MLRTIAYSVFLFLGLSSLVYAIMAWFKAFRELLNYEVVPNTRGNSSNKDTDPILVYT